MNDAPPPIAPSQPSPERRHGCLTALMVISGVVLLLPGLCALVFGGGSVIDGGKIDSDIAPLVFLGLVVGIGGVALIWAAIKGRKAPTHPGTQP
ncbi:MULTISPECIES: hypothetical protein [Bradyrhizobium]|jgi:hypothetical protein|uniref:Uncharacterized protein n=1 Tax=Bradyrhizobium arachidis TaxID=858423 RepID=A0AAE7NHQ7_9BRAD|nr:MULTISPECIES: hypothetical protein [Bradyrhizobium]QOG15989.1 hypothetical protein FOM02_00090 [Bradyrhizobium sp. SEMIA]QOZ65282.1 hypothetical protein WN72_01580 [Bradyrhizobium arachidis]UFW49809.1 hypothetical protein BaraCB756_01605 [Bradyrhizobium arachidis]SFU28193.1 hypothetical protein SAMN05192541_10119 [Bradyrhizobium arachidis]